VHEHDDYVYTDVAFRSRRLDRARYALRIGQYLIVGISGFWTLHGVSTQNWGFAAIEGMAAGAGLVLLNLRQRVDFTMLMHGSYWVAWVSIWAILLLLEGIDGPNSSFNQVWFLTLAVAVLLILFDVERRLVAFYVSLCAVSFAVAQFGWVSAVPIAPLPPDFIGPGRGVGLLAHFASLLFLLHVFIGEADKAELALAASKRRLEALLVNVLPVPISERLRREGATFADAHTACSVLFADIVGFTPLTSTTPPDALVRLLDGVFSAFDDLTDEFGMEKIKTIGDAYMAASGLPAAKADHAQAAVRLALGIRRVIAGYPELEVRIGINSGEVVAGLIGKHRLVYDLWGDTVNIASRMESHGIAGEIQVSEATYLLIQDEFDCELRGDIELKGRGVMRVYTVIADRNDAMGGAMRDGR